jgi:hypothetical protein
MNKQFFKDAFGWGLLLWLFGYILGIVFFMFIPVPMVGWIITPIATLVTLWVLVRKIKYLSVLYYVVVGLTWTIMAVVLDYFFIVKAFKPQDGYYKVDVYLYYFLTLSLPLIVGFTKYRNKKSGQ